MLHNSKLSYYKTKKIIQCFCLDLTATQSGLLLGLNRNTINRYFNIFRRAIYQYQIDQLKKLVGEIEVDESYFGANRVNGRVGKRGRGTYKQPVFGVYERNGRVYTEIIPNCNRRTLRKIITGKVDFRSIIRSIIYSDGWRGYDGLVDVGFDKHYRVRHHQDEFSNQKGVHINGIESFWSSTKRRLSKFNGVKKNFELHLKECEWRWNKTPGQLQSELIEILKCLDSR